MKTSTFQLFSSFRNRVIFIFFLIIIVPFLLFAYYAHIKSIEGISETNSKMSFSYLLQARKNFENYLTKLSDQINDLIGNKQLQDLMLNMSGTQVEEEQITVNLITLLYEKTPSIDAFRVRVYPIEPERYPAYMMTIDASVELAEQDWFRNSREMVSPTWYLTMPERGQYNKPLLTFVKRFTGLYDRNPRGIIAADLSEDHLKRYFSPTDQLKDQKLLLLNQNGEVSYDSSGNAWTGKPFPSLEFTSFIQDGREGSKAITVEGLTYLATYVQLRMESQLWSIVSLTPLHELTGTIDEINRLLIIFLIVYLICCIGVVIYITARFTEPIAHLVRLMRRLESDNLHKLLPWSSRQDEVGWLYRGVGSLVQRIEGLVEEASRSERKKKELEFQVLSHQINPHFLYNTLESIRWKAENHGRSDISEMVSALGNLLRLSLNQGREITTLRRELEQVKAYVLIEQARMGKQVRIMYACDEILLDLPFLRLLLQPLVENAIQHSVRDNFEKGKIIISVRREVGDIITEIYDNGDGIPQEILDRLDEMKEENGGSTVMRRGVGLRNVNDRLKLYFGENYRLKIETEPGRGTKIMIKHPVLQEGVDVSARDGHGL
ncbi:sensor histidine kinase [Paenibacillus sp. GCM10012307]|uniref:histidine kinase n=1 Tax=Paenibacillus roseus TaxID=2798579 RepID=A0A934J618_9BACL|nr:sensor histidine kinase [Paenibacillus roseus]MBJ6362253.1 sensor histidine kinase [Paenibacillus roseus]